MRFSELKGLALLLVIAIAALWLSATGQLDLYIHPRYVVLTTVFAAIATALVLAAGYYAGHTAEADDDHNHDASQPQTGRMAVWRRTAGWLTVAVCVIGALALIAAKPAALTSATASQRGVNSGSVAAGSLSGVPTESPLFGRNDYSNLSVKDWSGLLAQVDDQDFFVGKTVGLTGFIVPDERDGKNVFYVSRFVVTCCAVDARPVGVPVHLPGWQQRFQENEWVKISGTFAANPSVLSADIVAVQADTIERTSEPEQAYDY